MLYIRCFNRIVLFACLFIFTLAAPPGYVQSSEAAQVRLEWDANTDTNVAGYKLYYGTQSQVYTNAIDVGNNTSYTVTGLQEGATYYFVVTAYNGSRLESEKSNEVSMVAPRVIKRIGSNLPLHVM